jgi:hypothetical protein
VEHEDGLLVDLQLLVPLLDVLVGSRGHGQPGQGVVGVAGHPVRPALFGGHQLLCLHKPGIENALHSVGLVDDQQVHVVLGLFEPAHLSARGLGLARHQALRRGDPDLRGALTGLLAGGLRLAAGRRL